MLQGCHSSIPWDFFHCWTSIDVNGNCYHWSAQNFKSVISYVLFLCFCSVYVHIFSKSYKNILLDSLEHKAVRKKYQIQSFLKFLWNGLNIQSFNVSL